MTIAVDPDWWKTLFDDVYLVTDARSVCDDELTRREVDLFCRLASLQRTDRIVDLCGGHGRHSLELCRRGFSGCMVFDYSRSLLHRGRKSARRHRRTPFLCQCDARWVPLADATCDHVLILGNSLGYLPGEEADRRIVAESRRLLKNGGQLLLDLADGRQVRERFIPEAWHEIGPDVVVCRRRELGRRSVRAREMVISKTDGLIRDCNYRIRLYTPESVHDLLDAAGFISIRVHDDFRSHEDDQDYGFMNRRMLVVGSKSQFAE